MLFQEKNEETVKQHEETVKQLLRKTFFETNESKVTKIVEIFHSSSSQTCKYLFKHIFDLPRKRNDIKDEGNDIKDLLQWAIQEKINNSVIQAIMYLIKHSFQNYGMEVSFMIEI